MVVVGGAFAALALWASLQARHEAWERHKTAAAHGQRVARSVSDLEGRAAATWRVPALQPEVRQEWTAAALTGCMGSAAAAAAQSLAAAPPAQLESGAPASAAARNEEVALPPPAGLPGVVGLTVAAAAVPYAVLYGAGGWAGCPPCVADKRWNWKRLRTLQVLRRAGAGG